MYKFIVFILKPLLKIFFGVKFTFEAPVPEGGALIICAKHISAPDPTFIMVSSKRPVHFMAKDSLFKNKLMAWFFKKMHAFPVRRGHADKQSYAASVEILQDGGVLGIMPEGTRVSSVENMVFKTGAVNLAVRTGAEILPVGIYTKGYKVKPFKKVYVRFGKPIKFDMMPPEEITKEKLQELTDTMLKPEILRLSLKDYVLEQ